MRRHLKAHTHRAVFSALFSVGVAPVFNAVLSYLGQACTSRFCGDRCLTHHRRVARCVHLRQQRLPPLNVRRRYAARRTAGIDWRAGFPLFARAMCVSLASWSPLTPQVRASRRHRRVLPAGRPRHRLHPAACVADRDLADLCSDLAAPLRASPPRALEPYGLSIRTAAAAMTHTVVLSASSPLD